MIYSRSVSVVNDFVQLRIAAASINAASMAQGKFRKRIRTGTGFEDCRKMWCYLRTDNKPRGWQRASDSVAHATVVRPHLYLPDGARRFSLNPKELRKV